MKLQWISKKRRIRAIVLIFLILTLVNYQLKSWFEDKEVPFSHESPAPTSLGSTDKGDKWTVFAPNSKLILSKGLCDRLRGVYLTYLFSLVTGRRFTLDLKIACFNDFMKGTDIVPWHTEMEEWKAGDGVGNGTLILSDFRHKGYFCLPTKFHKTKQFSSRHCLDFSKELSTIDLKQTFGDSTRTWFLSTNQYAYTKIYQNPLYSERLLSYNFHQNVNVKAVNAQRFRQIISHSLFKQIFSPKEVLARKVQDIVSELRYGEDNNGLVCAHVRFTERGLTALKGAYLTTLFAKMLKHASKFPKVGYFIASDSPYVMKKFLFLCPTCHVTRFLNDDSIGHVGEEHDNCSVTERTLLDLYVLSECDVIYTSPGSGYSDAAIYMRRKPPLIHAYIAPSWKCDQKDWRNCA